MAKKIPSVESGSFEVEAFSFPGGELQVQVVLKEAIEKADMIWKFKSSDDIIELLLVVDALKRMFIKPGKLHMSYVPFARQDRINAKGEAFSLGVFTDLINNLGFEAVHIADPHSDVTTALLKNAVVQPQWNIACPVIDMDNFNARNNDFYLISPDAGAMKKIFKLAEKFTPRPTVVECSKNRDTATGKITGVKVNFEDLGGKRCYIVDDICDGGRTFVEIAKVLKTKNAGPITLIVTHGLFTAPTGLGVFDGLIDHVYSGQEKVK